MSIDFYTGSDFTKEYFQKAKDENNHFILTTYINRRNELRLKKSRTIDDANFIDESEMELNKGFNILSSNQSPSSIIQFFYLINLCADFILIFLINVFEGCIINIL